MAYSGSVPATCYQAFEHAFLGRSFIEVKRLRVELGGELFDRGRLNQISPGSEPLADMNVLKIELL